MRAVCWTMAFGWLLAAGVLAGCFGDDDEPWIDTDGGPGCVCWGLAAIPDDPEQLTAAGDELAQLGFDCARAGGLDEEQWYECNWLAYDSSGECDADADAALAGLEAAGIPATTWCPCVCDA